MAAKLLFYCHTVKNILAKRHIKRAGGAQNSKINKPAAVK
jgi:hypothetical protein